MHFREETKEHKQTAIRDFILYTVAAVGVMLGALCVIMCGEMLMAW
jgi:hypothetical protein